MTMRRRMQIKPLQSAYLFYHFNENQISRNESKKRYAKLAMYDFQFFFSFFFLYIIWVNMYQTWTLLSCNFLYNFRRQFQALWKRGLDVVKMR